MIAERQFGRVKMRRELGTMVGKHIESNWDGMQTLNRDVLFAAPQLWMSTAFSVASGGNSLNLNLDSTQSRIYKRIIIAAT